METDEPIGADEAAAALASVRHSRARVAWSGYPAWYWLAVGACLAAGACAVLLPLGWALAACASLVVLVITATRAACRARGVCEGWARSAMTRRDRAVLYGPATAVIFASGLTSRTAAWPSAVAAVLVFLLFAGTGLALSARPGRR
jgi:hypothetical protein